MTPTPERKDLVVLVADKNMEMAVRGLLSRHQSLHIRPISVDIFIHPERDPGCRLRSQDFLRPFRNRYDYALVMFDWEGCGSEQSPREELETGIKQQLSQSGWPQRAAVIVIAPELDIWVWSASPHVPEILGWSNKSQDLQAWLKENGFLSEHAAKPDEPKRALESVLRVARKPRSAAIYSSLAQRVSLKNCTDPAFLKLKKILGSWFPPK